MGESTERQYVACSFKGGGRQYTYHYDGPLNLEVGMFAEAGSGKVRIDRIVPKAPAFPTKPLGEIFPKPEPEAAEADG